jgi:hypothetical protein
MTNQELELKLIELQPRIERLEKGVKSVDEIRPVTCNDYGFIYDVCSRCGMPWRTGHNCRSVGHAEFTMVDINRQ